MQLERSHSSTLASGQTEAGPGFRASTSFDHDERDPAIVSVVARVKAGDMAAMRFLYVRYKDNVYGYVLSIVRDEYAAEDVTQHVFLKLMSAIHKYQPGEAPFASWLLRVARNVAVDHLRQRRQLPCEEVYEASREADDAGRERRWGLEHALKALPDEQRDVVVLRHLVGLTPAEIADRMGRTEASIHGLHHRARKVVRRELMDVACAPTVRAIA
ncbi:MAG: sigma-70 family RNA polymerase sigma factor [Solirubrobacteraceae bacterium]